MSKRRKYRYWSKEEKHRIIRRLIDEEIGENKSCLLYTSDLIRASITADYIGNYFSIDPIENKSLREINNGVSANQTKEWENKNKLYNSIELEIDKPLWDNSETLRDLFNRM